MAYSNKASYLVTDWLKNSLGLLAGPLMWVHSGERLWCI